jgi:hypothetical protein
LTTRRLSNFKSTRKTAPLSNLDHRTSKTEIRINVSHLGHLRLVCFLSQDGCDVQSKSVDEWSKLLLQSSSYNLLRRQQGTLLLPVSDRHIYSRTFLTVFLDTLTTAVPLSRSPAPTSPSSQATLDQPVATASTQDSNLRSSRLAEQPHLKMMLRLCCQLLDLQRMVKL